MASEEASALAYQFYVQSDHPSLSWGDNGTWCSNAPKRNFRLGGLVRWILQDGQYTLSGCFVTTGGMCVMK